MDGQTFRVFRFGDHELIRLKQMPTDQKNPYRSPSAEYPNSEVAETGNSKPRMLRYVWSFLLLFVMTALLAPGDNGAWLNRAVTIELGVYLVFLMLQLLAFRGWARKVAISIGPVFCFIASVNLVVYWTLAIENGFLPKPG